MRKKVHAAGHLALVLVCLLPVGCGSNSDLARVKGRVTLEGQPLEDGTVRFQPIEEGGSSSSGTTDAKGRYELMYSFDTPGATPGEHVVSIRTGGTDFDEQGNEIQREERIPARYNSETTLRRTVKPGRNTFDFEL